MAEKQKKAYAGTELAGKKLGVIGLGAIGVKVANAATHLGMDVYGYDPYISVQAAWNLSRSVSMLWKTSTRNVILSPSMCRFWIRPDR